MPIGNPESIFAPRDLFVFSTELAEKSDKLFDDAVAVASARAPRCWVAARRRLPRGPAMLSDCTAPRSDCRGDVVDGDAVDERVHLLLDAPQRPLPHQLRLSEVHHSPRDFENGYPQTPLVTTDGRFS